MGARVCYLSTDYVFDGTKAEPYDEWDTPSPRSVYGRSKLGGELALGAEDTVGAHLLGLRPVRRRTW